MQMFKKLLENKKEKHAFEMTDNIDELFEEIIKRNRWRDFPHYLLKNIIDKAEGDTDLIKKFVYISEYNKILEEYILPIIDFASSEDEIMELVGINLYDIGYENHPRPTLFIKDKVQYEKLVILAECAYISALLFDNYMIMASNKLAFLFCIVDREIALEYCNLYELIENELIAKPDSELNYNQLLTKQLIIKSNNMNIDSNNINNYKNFIKHDPEGQAFFMIREMKKEVNNIKCRLGS